MAKRKISGIINATEHPMNLETPWNQKQPDGTYHAYAGDDIEAFLKKELSNRTPTEELVSGVHTSYSYHPRRTAVLLLLPESGNLPGCRLQLLQWIPDGTAAIYP